MDRAKAVAVLIAFLTCSTPACRKAEPELTVGSKNFTEQLILGEIIAQHLEYKLKRPVQRKLNLGGTLLAHQALLSGDVDVYPEYTGTALLAILKLDMQFDPQLVFSRVSDVYKSDLQAEWMPPLGFNNSFAMTILKTDADAQHLNTIGEAAASDTTWRLGVGYEFSSRPDGLRALNSKYSLKLASAPVTMDLGLLYRALDQKQVNMIAANMTDGQLRSDKYKILKDDAQAFPPYQAAIIARTPALEKFPGLKAALLELSGKISDDEMRNLNYEVDIRHRGAAVVASEFLRTSGLQK